MINLSKTKLMPHQNIGVARMKGEKGFALLMEQGTGKSLTFIEEALQEYAAGEIELVFILAPNGVHENWILDQVPTHIPETVEVRAAYYCSEMNKKERQQMDWTLRARRDGEVPPLRFIGMSYDSLLTDKGWDLAIRAVRSHDTLLIADESQHIKSPSATRTKRALTLRKYAKIRRIGTGTVATNGPVDVFSQFRFLEDEDEQNMLGTASLPVFRAEYCELLTPGHGLLRHLVDRMERAGGRSYSDEQRRKILERTQVVAKDSTGRPVYKNLDRLKALIAPHSFRVLKEEVLKDLPPKTYSTRYFHLPKTQRASYNQMEKELRYVMEDGTVSMATKLTALGKLRQMTSGFIMFRDGTIEYLEDNARIKLLEETVEGETRSVIIWAQYKEEIRNIVKLLRSMGLTADAVNGEVAMVARRQIREDFQSGALQFIVAHPGAMGTGFTLTAATLVIYYSNDFSLGGRLQSEDRAHRIGQKKSVQYLDFVAIDTKDDDVVYALQHKLNTASMIQGDPARQERWAPR
jgi:superfamily II DNA or RNA helicase